MRIDDTSPSGISTSAARGSQKARSADGGTVLADKTGEVGKKGDKVQFSNVASNVSAQSLSISQSASAERAVKIDQLTELVQTGQYNPDPAKTADAMIRDMLSGSSAL